MLQTNEQLFRSRSHRRALRLVNNADERCGSSIADEQLSVSIKQTHGAAPRCCTDEHEQLLVDADERAVFGFRRRAVRLIHKADDRASS